MAKVVFGPIVSEARNKQGNLVFSRNASGAFTRAYTMPDETETAARLAVWARHAAVQAAWQNDLTAAQRLTWGSFSRRIQRSDVFGAEQILTARHAFNVVNLNRLNIGAALLTEPPPTTRAGALSTASLALDCDAETLTLNADWPAATAQPAVVLYATPPQSGARLSANGLYKQVAVLPADQSYPTDMWNEYCARMEQPTPTHPYGYDQPRPGEKVFARLKPIDPTTGLAGTPLAAIAIGTGTEGPMYKAVLDLTSAQILALFTTPVEIIAAPGAGLVLDPCQLTADFKHNTIAYTIGPASVLRVYPQGTPERVIFSRPMAWLVDAGVSRVAQQDLTDGSINRKDIENTPLLVDCTVQNPTNGNGTMRLVIHYNLLTLS